MQGRLEEDKKQKKHRKPILQGWFKGGSSSTSHSNNSGSGPGVGSQIDDSVSSLDRSGTASRNSGSFEGNPHSHNSPNGRGPPRNNNGIPPHNNGYNVSPNIDYNGRPYDPNRGPPVLTAVCVQAPPGGAPTTYSKDHGNSVDDVSVLSSVADGTGPTESVASHSAMSGSSGNQNQIVDALINGMDDDRMCDITLVGRDNCKVRATKFVLACRSPALQEVLYKDPANQEVFIGNYGDSAIRALKEFCHTGAINTSVLLGAKSAESARGLVELASMARIYGFEPLYAEADAQLYDLINSSPWFSTASFDASGPETQQIEDFLLEFIKLRCPDLLLETNAMKHLSKERLLVLLDGIECAEKDMLKYLEKWVELKGATRENVSFLRATAAKKLDLKALLSDPEMVSHVRGSGIFDRYMVESMINASPIVEEQEEEDESDDDDEDDYDNGGQVNIYGASPPVTPSSLTSTYDEGALLSPDPSVGTEKKKKKKKDKDKKKKKKSSKSERRRSSLSAVDESDDAQTRVEE